MARRGLEFPITTDTRDFTRGVKKAEKDIGGLEKQTRGLGKSLVKPIAGFTSLAGAASLVKSSADAVTHLAAATSKVSRTTGFDTKVASEWVSIAEARGIEANQLNNSFVALSLNIEKAAGGAKKQSAAFRELGVSQEILARGDTAEVIAAVADGLARIPDAGHKAAVAQAVLGRSAQTLIPLLNGGSAALQEQLRLADRYGASLDENQREKVKEVAAAQRELNLAWDGARVALGMELMPIIADVAGGLAGFVREMHEGTGAGGEFADVAGDVAEVVGKISGFLEDHPRLIGIAAGAWVSYKATSIAALAAIKISTFRKTFGLGKAAAAGEGAAAGTTYAATFNATATAETAVGATAMSGKLRGVFGVLGKGLGVAMVAALAYEFRSELGKLLNSAVDDFVNKLKEVGKGFGKTASEIPGQFGNFITGKDVHGQSLEDKYDQYQASKKKRPGSRINDTGRPSAGKSSVSRRTRAEDRAAGRSVSRPIDNSETAELVGLLWRQIKRQTRTKAKEPALKFGGNADYYDPATHTVHLNRYITEDLSTPGNRQDALDTIYHELLHAAQRGSLSTRFAEGGAVVFTQRFARGAYSNLGIDYHPQSVSHLTPIYKSAARSVRRRGDDFIRKGQFDTGRSRSSERRNRLPGGDSGARTPTTHGTTRRPSAKGRVTGKTAGLSPELLKRLKAMSAGTGHAISVQSGRRSRQEQAILYQRYRSGRGPVAAPPGSSHHETGNAADITPGRSVFHDVAGQYGLAFTVPSEDWHIEAVGVPIRGSNPEAPGQVMPLGGSVGSTIGGLGGLGGLGSLGGGTAPVQKVSQGTAAGEGVAGVGTGTGDRFTDLRPMGNVTTEQGIQEQTQWISVRLAKIQQALSGKLREITRNRLLAEQAALTKELTALGEKWKALQPAGPDLAAQALDADLIASQLSGNKDWERSILQYRADIARQRYDQALTTTDRADDVETGQALQQTLDALKSFDESQQQQTQQTTDALKALTDELAAGRKVAESQAAIGWATATRAFADIISGEIAGKTAQRALSPGAGSVYRL